MGFRSQQERCIILRLVFLGPPGAGKGTQAGRLAQRLGVPHVSTGDIFRAAIAAGTPMGELARPYVESGRYVPDEIVVGIVRERLEAPDCAAGFVLDGFPRTVGQAEALDGLLAERGTPLDAVVHLVVADETVVRRLTGRRVCPRCGAIYHVDADAAAAAGRCARCGAALVQRDDDREDVVRRRLAVYREQTRPLVEYYRGRGLLRDVDGEGGVDEVARRIEQALGVAP